MRFRIRIIGLTLCLSLAPVAYGSPEGTKPSSAFAEQPTLKEVCRLVVKDPKQCIDLDIASGAFTANALAHQYGLALYSRGPSKIKQEFLPAKTPILTKELLDQARDTEIRRGTLLGKGEEKLPGLLRGIADRYAFLQTPAEEFANGFAVLAFRARRMETTLSDFLVERFGAQRETMDYLPLFVRCYFETLWKKITPAITAEARKAFLACPPPKRTPPSAVAATSPRRLEEFGRAIGKGIDARIKRVQTTPRPWSPPKPSVPPPQPKLVFSTAFTESPGLKRACTLVTTDPSVCRDLRVFHGARITDFLDHLSAAHFAESAKRIEVYESDLTPEHIDLAARELPDGDVGLLRTLADWLRRNTGQTRVLFFRPSGFSSVGIAQAYAKRLFGQHSSTIRPEFLALPGQPILTDDFVWDAYDAAYETGTALSRISSIAPEQGLLESIDRAERNYLAKPEVEFCQAFAFLAFRIERPKARLTDYLEEELRVQPDKPEQLAQIQKLIPAARLIDLVRVVDRRWHERLWSRVTPALKRR